MPIQPTTNGPSTRRDAGFSLVEIIVAMVILSVVITGFAVAVSSSERAGQHERVAANKAAIAKKAHEQLQGNIDAQRYCGNIWSSKEQASVNANSKAAVVYQSCTWPSSGTWRLQDEEGRKYDIVATLRPYDDPADGTGMQSALDTNGTGGDADFNTRDRIEVTVDVKLSPDSAAGIRAADAADSYTLRGRADWSETTGKGTARVLVCLLDRPDRAMANGRCVKGTSGEDRPAEPVSGVKVKLTPIGGGTAYTASSDANGIALFAGVLPEGAYDVSATSLGGRVLFKLAPQSISITGTDPQEGTVFLARGGSQVEVCGRIANKDNWGFGWKVTQATVNWGAIGAPLRRGLRINKLSNKWRCVSTGLVDPLGYSNTKLYRGRYVVEVSTVQAGGNPFKLTKIGACATGNKASWTMYNATIANPGKLVDPSVRRGLDFTERDGKKARICMEFYSEAIEALDCVSGDAGCVLVDKQCSPADCQPAVDCWNCGMIPVPPDSALPWIGPAGVHNGPNEGDVSCRHNQSATVWGNPYYAGYSQSSRSNWNGRNFLGVYNTYLSVQGKHPDGRWNECPEIAFTMARSYTNTCGGFSIGNPCPGSAPFSLGDCIEAKIGGRVVRGPLYDTFIAGQPSLGVEIGAWDRFIDHPAVDIDWWAGGASVYANATYGRQGYASPSWLTGWPRIRWRVVNNDPICQSSSVAVDPEDKIQDVVPAVIVEVWKKPGPDDVGDPIWPIQGLKELAPVTSRKSL